MGFWSALGKIAGDVGGAFIGDPLLGNQVGSAFDALGKSSGNASQAMASNRGTKLGVMMDQNSALERELLAREQEKRSARDDAYRNAIRGSIAYNYQPQATPAGIPHFDVTGGTMGNPQAHSAGDELLKQSMNRLTQPDLQVNGGGSMPTYRNLAQDPEFQRALNPGAWEKFLGITSALAPVGNFFTGGGAPQSGNNPAYGYNPQGSVVK